MSPFDVAALMRECASLWDSLDIHKKACLRDSAGDITISAFEEMAELEGRYEDVSVHD